MAPCILHRRAVRDVIYPMLSALAYMHSENIVHRDVKVRGARAPTLLHQPLPAFIH